MLANTTGANVANQAAMMAGQRGTSSNAGLLARQAALQGGNIQQQAAGQGAALQAQQSLNALSGMGNMATQQAVQQQQATQAKTGAQMQEQQNLLNSIAGQNQSNVAMQGNINSANAGMASGVMQGQQALMGGLMNGAGASMGMSRNMMAEGGEIDDSAETGPMHSHEYPHSHEHNHGGARSHIGRTLGESPNPTSMAAPVDTAPGPQRMTNVMAQGGKVPALLSPGERYLPPQAVEKVAQGANPMKEGKTVPGKPKVGGAQNNYSNDTVKTELDEGGIVLPRSVTQSTEAVKKADQFVRAILAKHRGLPPKKK